MTITDFDKQLFTSAYAVCGRGKMVELLARYRALKLREVKAEDVALIRADMMEMLGMDMNAATTRLGARFSAFWRQLLECLK